MSDESRSALDPEKIPRRRGLHIRDIKEEAPEPELNVGTELKAAREEAGKELNDVAAALRIKPEHLISLEAAEYDKLPAKTYVVGFVRQYAQQLGLDANELVERLKVEIEGPPPAETEAPAKGRIESKVKGIGPAGPVAGMGGGTVSTSEEESRLPTMSIAIVVVLLLVVIFGGWFLMRPSGESSDTADTEAETGSSGQPSEGNKPSEESRPNLPKPPVVPASAGGEGQSGTQSETPAHTGGSLTALLPGADRLSAADAAQANKPALKMPDAAAAAVPIEHANDVSEGGTTENAGAGDASLRTGDVVETAMPQPKLALRTGKTHLPGVPEDAVEDEEDAEPALAEIEAEGVGGAADNGEEAETPQTTPRPKRLAASEPAEESGVYGASTVKSRVTLRVRSSTWVRVEDADGRVIVERDMRSGDSFRAPDMDGLYLVTKDAGAIELMVDGQSIGRAGRPRQVLTGLQLAPDQLKQRVAQNTASENQ